MIRVLKGDARRLDYSSYGLLRWSLYTWWSRGLRKYTYTLSSHVITAFFRIVNLLTKSSQTLNPKQLGASWNPPGMRRYPSSACGLGFRLILKNPA